MSRAALHVFTVFPGDPSDADGQNSRDVEIAVVELAYREHPDAEVESRTIWRDGFDDDSEIELLHETIDWLQAHPFDELLTYDGELLDTRHLVGRAGIHDQDTETTDLAEYLHVALRSGVHRDLLYDARQEYGPHVAFDGLLEEIEGRQPHSHPCLDGGQIPVHQLRHHVQELLKHQDGNGDITASRAEQIRGATEGYLTSRVVPLFRFCDEFETGEPSQSV